MKKGSLQLINCPICKNELFFEGCEADAAIQEGCLFCKRCKTFLRQRLEAMRQHTEKKGQNHKKILENQFNTRNPLLTGLSERQGDSNMD